MTLHSLTRLTTRLLILLQTFPRQTALFQFAQFIKRATYFALALSASIAYGNDLTITPSSGNTERSELIKDLEREPIGLDGAALPPDYALQLEDIQIENFDLWERIRKGYAIPDLNNPLVSTQTTWYSARPEYIQRISQRASRYLFHVVQELEKRKMPTEIALLPFIESAFNPQAFSSAKACGSSFPVRDVTIT